MSFEDFFGPLWLWLAGGYVIAALMVIGFAVKITHGAGFGSRIALLRLIQRLALAAFSVALLLCADHMLQTRRDPSALWIFFTLSGLFAGGISWLRLTWMPDMPYGESWQHPSRLRTEI